MRYLLDTCSFIWFASDDRQLSTTAKGIIENESNEGFLSVLSLWEISMKAVSGKLSLGKTLSELSAMSVDEGLSVLPLTTEHVEAFHRLPPTHRVPFGRLLAAIAIEGGYTFLSPETELDDLGVVRLW